MSHLNTQESQARLSMSGRSSSSVVQKQSSFEMKDMFIKRIWYLAESILLVLTSSLEFRVFYTQKLDYGAYNPKTFALEMYNKKLHSH